MGTRGGGPPSLSEESSAAGFFFDEGLAEEEFGLPVVFAEETNAGISLSSDDSTSFFDVLAFFFLDFLLCEVGGGAGEGAGGGVGFDLAA